MSAPSNIPPSGREINVLDQQYTPIDFSSMELVQHNKNNDLIQVLWKEKGSQQNESPQISERCIKPLTKGIDSENMTLIAQTLDQIAEKEIGILGSLKNNPQFDRRRLGEQLQILESHLKHLDNLIHNLGSHNLVIVEWNRRPIPNLDLCYLHDLNPLYSARESVLRRIEECRKREHSLKKDSVSEQLNQALDRLEINIVKDGQRIDRQFIKESYPAFLRKILNLMYSNPHQAAKLERRYIQLVNRGFIATMMDDISKAKLDLPVSAKALLMKLGINKIFIRLEESRKDLLTELEKLKADEASINQSVSQLVDKTETLILEFLANRFKILGKQKENLLNLIQAAKNFEVNCEETGKLIFQHQQSALKDKLLEKVGQNKISKEFFTEMVGKIDQLQFIFSKFPAFFNELLDPEFQKAIFGKPLNTSLEALSSDGEDGQSLVAQYRDLFLLRGQAFVQGQVESQLLHVSEEIAQHREENLAPPEREPTLEEQWFKENDAARVLRFDQDTWGDHEILGQGVCAALAFEWIMALRLDPTRRIRSLRDLQPETTFETPMFAQARREIQADRRFRGAREAMRAGQREVRPEEWEDKEFDSAASARRAASLNSGQRESGITPSQRKIQAEIVVSPDLEAFTIPRSILERAHVEERILIHREHNIRSPEGVVCTLLTPENLQRLQESGGLVYLYMQGDEDSGSHAIVIQMVPDGVYRILDSSDGVFQYSTLDQFQSGFIGYINAHYPGYDWFAATQFIPKARGIVGGGAGRR